jgi:hypothetical protein
MDDLQNTENATPPGEQPIATEGPSDAPEPSYAEPVAAEPAPDAEPASDAPAPDSGADDDLGGATSPGLGRPAPAATNSKLAGPPPVADQPGLGRAANPEPVPGPRANLGVDRVGAALDRAEANREAAARG